MRRNIVMTAAILFACGDGSSAVTGLPEEVEYAPSLGVNLATMQKTAGGVYYSDLVIGNGTTAATGDIVDVTYTGWLVDATRFDSGSICLPLASFILGWREGVPGMLVGGTRKLVIPPALGYGQGGSGAVIPGNATLVFDIQLNGLPSACP